MKRIPRYLKQYQSLKWKYYNMLDTQKTSKGELRALIGLTTWQNESRMLKAESASFPAHVRAFRYALEEISDVVNKGRVTETLGKRLRIWKKEKQLLPRTHKGKCLLYDTVTDRKGWKRNGYTVISLFSGAFGLDLGFLAAGFALRLANDSDKMCAETALLNLPSVPFIHRDFLSVNSYEIFRVSGLSRGEVDVLVGGPPCQPFSTAGKRLGFHDSRSSPVAAFVNAVKQLRPRIFVMEEVTGFISARLKHLPIAQREGRNIEPEEQKGSAFSAFLKALDSTGYDYVYGVLNAANFGAPQTRERVIIIGSRNTSPSLPQQSHSMVPIAALFGKNLKPWVAFWEAVADLDEHSCINVGLSEARKKYMKYIPPGGHWRQLPQSQIADALGGAYNAGGGKMGFFRRLAWDEPSPTVVTSPVQKGTMFCHPEALRPLSIEEYKRVQGFPDDWVIPGGPTTQYRLIGNAVPVYLSYAIAKHVFELLKAKNGGH